MTFLWPISIYWPIMDQQLVPIYPTFFLLHYQKYNVFYLFFKNLKNQDLWAKIFQIAAISISINLINDDAFVSATMADACSMVHLVCLSMKTHLLALQQDSCLDLVRCAFLHKLSACMRNIKAFCQHLLSPIPIYWWNPNIGLYIFITER